MSQQNQHQIDVIAAGLLCLDMIPNFTGTAPVERIGDVLRPGTLVQTGPMTFGTGGSVSNVGIAMKIFGCRVGFAAKVGEDSIGRIIVEILRQNGSAEGIHLAPGENSSYTVVLSPPGIDRIFVHCPGTNDTFTSADLDLDIVSRARLFHLGYPTLMRSLYLEDGAETARILEAVKATGVTTSLDISLPDPNSEAGRINWRRFYERSLPHTDIYVPSLEETFFTLHPQEYLKRKAEAEGQELLDYVDPQEVEGFADEYLAMGCKIVVIKNGHNGWFIKTAGAASLEGLGRALPQDRTASPSARDGTPGVAGTPGAGQILSRSQWLDNWAKRRLWCPAFRVDRVASTTGAGDSSIAGFLTALLQGRSIEDSLKLANAAGALNLRAVDTLSGLGSWSEVEEAARAMKPRQVGILCAPWTWSKELGLWQKEEAS
ncbi:MAG: carbohydrate kinase family protein [Spirochaetales bacterium]|nr:carbohydrate kinase family protein [Spirochaetales bacterium]